MKPFLILQLRPEDKASDGEYEAFLRAGRLRPEETRRIRMDQGDLPRLNLNNYAGVIVGGGPSNVSSTHKSDRQIQFEAWLQRLLSQVVQRDFPYFGACYGLGILANSIGGPVSKERYGEPVGAITVTLTKEGQVDPLTKGLPTQFRAFVGHKEACQQVPPQSTLLIQGDACPVQMIRVKQNMYASQFHPELDGPGLALRIKIYKDAGYFPPEDAEELVQAALNEEVTIPESIFERFIERYRN